MYEQAWLLPHGITALAPTSTRFGVSMRDLIRECRSVHSYAAPDLMDSCTPHLITVASRKHNVHHVPRRLLDPRRPTGKPSPAEAEEGLITYDAVLPTDSQLVLSHDYEVSVSPFSILSTPSHFPSFPSSIDERVRSCTVYLRWLM